MSVIVIGVNQRSVPIDVFEKLAIGEDRLVKVLDDLTSSEDIAEVVILSTCNRTEIYLRAERFHPAYADVRDSLGRHSGLPLEAFAEHLYAHHDGDAVRHLFGVACGLDSAVLGETEILGQVRRALDQARSAGVVGLGLSDLFTASGTAGRKVRASTGIARNITSVSRAAVAMATKELGTLDGRSICVLGAGEMSEGMTVALRPLSQLEQTVAEVDVLLTGTGANALMIEQHSLAAVMAERPSRPLLIVDIAVPRDVDPAAGDIDGVTLLDMEDLRAFAEVGRAERRGEIAAVRQVIDEEVSRFMATTASRRVEPLAAAFRRDVELLRVSEVDRISATLDDNSKAHIDASTRAVLNKFLHRPMLELRESAGTARGERLAESLRELFGIELDED